MDQKAGKSRKERPPTKPKKTGASDQDNKQRGAPRLSPASSHDLSTTSSGSGVISVTKTLAQLQSIPTNRSCAECRSPLLDPSQTFVSFTPSLGEEARRPHVTSAVGEFKFHHASFAPPGEKARNDEPADPALKASQLVGGFGVFVCAACGAAHKSLGDTLCTVNSVLDTSAWTPEQVEFLSKAGGNSRSWAVFECFIPQSWNKRRPSHESTHSQRLTFVRAKYDALAFLTPPSVGPKAGPAWSHIVERRPELKKWATNDLKTIQRITLVDSQSSHRIVDSTSISDAPLPQRLVDFFCVVGHSGRLAPEEVNQSLSERKSPQDVCLEVKVTDCYPPADAYSDMDFPEHISTFVFPEGCRPSEMQSSPTMFTFVLTSANGQRLYGAAMHVYDEQMDTENIRQILEASGYTGPLPWWLCADGVVDEDSGLAVPLNRPPELVYIPTCLVVLSHYPFFDVWRRFLTHIYRITMVEAPLPIERYIANFVSEVPLPPLGKVEVQFGFASDDTWSISRPAVNELPLANFSFRPLFASLSVGNIILTIACLMQEISVALLSSHYALFGPCAEALLSLLFPFEWQGMYIPVMPFAMLDILDAPVPFLVGLHSRYLKDVPHQYRPKSVVFVDLDKDEVHLGCDDQVSNGNQNNLPARSVPEIPDKDASKLKGKLQEFGGTAYLLGSNGIKGRIFTGDKVTIQNLDRPYFAQMSRVDMATSSAPRMQTLGKSEKAFPDDQQLKPIAGFWSEQGHTSLAATNNDKEDLARKRDRFNLKRLTDKIVDKPNGDTRTRNVSSTTVLEMAEPPGFSTVEIRNAFLRFFVTTFLTYEKFVVKGAGSSRCPFRSEDFLMSLNLSPGSYRFLARVLQTQMFERFVQERKVNPTSPSILFFDESIIAKNNRSKKTTLASGGKQKTPFLDDRSGEITEVYTPPPPSNWGLPDGRTYHYGSFPSLQVDLFGKVRPPKKFPRQKAENGRTVASAVALKQQQQLIAKAVGRSSMVPTLLTSSGGRPSVRNMDWALRVLSGDAGETTSRLKVDEKAESRSSAQEQVLAARRKQGILVEIIIVFQSYCRMFIARLRFEKQLKAMVNIQRRSRCTSPKQEQEQFRDTLACAILVQKSVRSFQGRRQYVRLQASAILVQRVARGAVARRAYRSLKAALLLQRWVRGSLVRWYWSELSRCTIIVQAIVRGRRSRFGYRLIVMDVSRGQAQSRGFLTRRLVSGLVKQRTLRYRQQIFSLWQHAHTPLSYRTKMWPLLDGVSFLSLTLAESELQRLWLELDVSFPRSPRNRSLFKGDGHFELAKQAGLSNRKYLSYTKVQAMIETSKRSDDPAESSTWFLAEGSSLWKKAADREAQERLQIYERLQAEQDKARLQSIYDYFEIKPSDKRKKSTLVDRLWDKYAYASRSVAILMALFPELEYGNSMNFVSPSKKGQKRYHVGKRMPAPLDSSMQVETIRNNLIRSNLREFVTAFTNTVPALMMRFEERERKKSNRSALQQRAEMYARKMEDWSQCRYNIIMDFLYPRQAITRGKHRKSKTRTDHMLEVMPFT